MLLFISQNKSPFLSLLKGTIRKICHLGNEPVSPKLFIRKRMMQHIFFLLVSGKVKNCYINVSKRKQNLADASPLN